MMHLNDYSFATEEERELQKTLIDFRKKLHRTLQHRILEWGWICTDKTLDEVKRIFLWLFYKKETSKALDLFALKEAIEEAKKLDENLVIEVLEKRNEEFQLNNYKRNTHKQVCKLARIMRYVIGLKEDAIRDYIKETTGRRTYLSNLTVNEADAVIKRVEKWEAKITLERK